MKRRKFSKEFKTKVALETIKGHLLAPGGSAERLWRTPKYEDIYVQEYESVQELVESLKAHFDFYNNERTHHGLGGKTPARFIGMNYK